MQAIVVANQILNSTEFVFQRTSSETVLVENDRGMVIKLVATEKGYDVDTYYSYPCTSPSGDTVYKFDAYQLQTTPDIMEQLAAYAHAHGLAVNLQAVEEKASISAYAAFVALFADIPLLTAVSAKTKAIKKEERRFKTLKISVAFFSFAAASVAVQVALQYYRGRLGLYFMAFFFSGLLGVLLNQFINEAILTRAVPRYKEKLNLGNSRFSGELFIIAYSFNIILYLATFIFTPTSATDRIALLIGFIFSVYPMNFLMNTMFAMKKEVINNNAHRTNFRTRYYANTVPEPIRKKDMPPVTIGIAIYTEDNRVVFDTMRDSLIAIQNYALTTGQVANLIVSDDGIFKLLSGKLNEPIIADYIQKFYQPGMLSAQEMQAVERIIFYRQNNISFVARSIKGRPGKFKKGGNLNYTYRLAEELAQGATRKALLDRDSDFYGGYFEGDITIHELLLILDKDSGVPPHIIASTVPEFILDPKLAYTQHCTKSINSKSSYFTKAMGNFLNTLSETHLPNKALQGLIVPLMGHNAFVRKSFLFSSGMWAEDRVSEDLAKSLDAYRMGFHGKYATYKDLDFTEYVCETFIDETAKQQRYCYGIHEMIFRDFKEHFAHHAQNKPYEDKRKQKLKPFYLVDLFTYFCSCINIAACIPTTVFLMFTIFVQYFFGGIIINLIVYIIIPVLHAYLMNMKTGKLPRLLVFTDFAILGFTFFGHSYSMMKGSLGFIVDTLTKSYNPFNVSSVDHIEKNFLSGMQIIYVFFRKNLPMLAVVLMFLTRGIIIALNESFTLSVGLSVGYLISYIFVVPALTPQLFHRPRILRKRAKIAQIEEISTVE